MNYDNKKLNLFKLLYQKGLERYSKFHHLDFLVGPNVLVFSPHPDDDVFGCGGSIIRHVEQGHNVYIIYLCQGEKGIKDVVKEKAAKIRRAESIKASKILGVPSRNLFYLRQNDNNLKVNKVVINAINGILHKVKPNIIYTPTFIDNHPDHYQTNLILKKCKVTNCLIAGYEIWTPHFPNRIVDISNEIGRKILSIKEHKSQLIQLDYLSAITGLNKYRASLYSKKKFAFAESFLILKQKDYFSLIE